MLERLIRRFHYHIVDNTDDSIAFIVSPDDPSDGLLEPYIFSSCFVDDNRRGIISKRPAEIPAVYKLKSYSFSKFRSRRNGIELCAHGSIHSLPAKTIIEMI